MQKSIDFEGVDTVFYLKSFSDFVEKNNNLAQLDLEENTNVRWSYN